MKTKIKNLLKNVIKELKLREIIFICWFEASRRVKDFKSWQNDVIFYSVMSCLRYKTSIHEVFGKSAEAQSLYRSLKNKYYDYLKILKELGTEELRKILSKSQGKSAGWLSGHKIYLVIDETPQDRTTDGFEEIKKLPGHPHCHVVVNLLLVINDKSFHVPINQRVLPAKRTKGSKIHVACEMIEEILSRLSEEGYNLEEITLCGDREYLCRKIFSITEKYKMSFICKLKRNTVLQELEDEKELWFQVNNWIKEEWESGLKGFKWSSQLSDWCRKHGHPPVWYKSKMFRTKVLGIVRVVMEIDEDTKTPKDVNIYVSTALWKSAVRIIREYREIRWIIEDFHRSEKQDIEVEKSYQGRKIAGIRNHNVMKCLGYFILMLWKRQNRKSTWCMGELKRFLNEEYLMSLNPGKYNVFLKKLN